MGGEGPFAHLWSPHRGFRVPKREWSSCGETSTSLASFQLNQTASPGNRGSREWEEAVV